MSTRPHQPCGNAWLVTPHSCPASRQIRDLMMLYQLLRASRRTKSSTMLHLPSRLRLSPALSRPWTGAVAAWSAPDGLPRLAILGPPLMPPIWFSRTKSALSRWMMPSSARCLPDVKEIYHRGRAASRSSTQQLLRLLYGLHELCSGPGTQHARPSDRPIRPKYSLRPYSTSGLQRRFATLGLRLHTSLAHVSTTHASFVLPYGCCPPASVLESFRTCCRLFHSL